MQPARGAITVFTLCACALAAAQAPAPVPTPTPYTAETTYKKLVKNYPFIRIASSELPATVRAVRDITYIQRGEHALQLDLYLPVKPAGAALPAIVLVHGGGWQSGVRDNFAPMAIRMAENGFAAATVSYRLSPEARYPAAIHDVKAALRWVRAHAGEYGIDPARIAVGGGSAGGQIASLVGVTGGIAAFDPDKGDPDSSGSPVSSAAQAIVNIDGLSDFTSDAARKDEDNRPSNRHRPVCGSAAAMRSRPRCGAQRHRPFMSARARPRSCSSAAPSRASASAAKRWWRNSRRKGCRPGPCCCRTRRTASGCSIRGWRRRWKRPWISCARTCLPGRCQ